MFSDCEQNSGLPISGSQILTLSSVSRRLHSAFGFADAIGVQLLPGWSTRQHHCPARTHESFCWVCWAGSASSNTFWLLCRPAAERDSTEVNWELQSGSKSFDQSGAVKKPYCEVWRKYSLTPFPEYTQWSYCTPHPGMEEIGWRRHWTALWHCLVISACCRHTH